MNSTTKRCVSVAAALISLVPFRAPVEASNYARDMFYQELKHPTQASLHGPVGISYWIELRRNGRMQKVDSRFHFKAGDKIKFHITPSIDGHAHIVLLRGSSGAQAILFPIAGKDPTNVVKRGRDMTIPSTTFLVFDNTKGREHVRIGLSRRDEDTAAFLEPAAVAKMAMAQISSNPAIDPTGGKAQIKISFPEDMPKPKPVPVKPRPEPVVAVAPPTNDAPVMDAIPNEDNSKDLFREDTGPTHYTPRPRPSGGHHVYRPAHHTAHRPSGYRPPATYTPPPPPPSTVVINTNSSEDLYADIALEHD